MVSFAYRLVIMYIINVCRAFSDSLISKNADLRSDYVKSSDTLTHNLMGQNIITLFNKTVVVK